MLRHVVLFTWKEGTTDTKVGAVADALRGLPSRIAEIRRYDVGSDLGLRDGNADFAVTADFDDEAGWKTYVADDEHQRVIRELITPILGSRLAVQFQV